MMANSSRSRRNPGRPAASPDRDARDLLLAAATDLFASHGVAATTFAMIAKRAGMTPAMVHYYFASRDQLLDVVVEERIAPLIASVWGPVAAGTPAEDLIRGIVERLLAGVQRMPWIPSTWMKEILNESGLLRSRMLRQLPFEKLKILEAAIARGQASAEINSNIDPGLTVFSIIGLVMLHTATASFWADVSAHRKPETNTMCRHITSLLLNGLQPVSPARSRKRQGEK